MKLKCDKLLSSFAFKSSWRRYITVHRSSKAPVASMKLEHAHGYAGLHNLSTNLFYTANPSEVVYYVAGTGVVLNRDTHTQKHFFGQGLANTAPHGRGCHATSNSSNEGSSCVG